MSDKERNDAYREAARRLYARDGFQVPHFGSVQPSEGGAFVEAMVWVPATALAPGEDQPKATA